MAYLRITQGDDNVICNLVFAKARVCPVKGQTIPRHELIATYIGVKLIKFLKTELRLHLHWTIIWTDSQCTLHWILGKAESTKFVQNRVNFMKMNTSIEYRYVPSAQNSADVA